MRGAVAALALISAIAMPARGQDVPEQLEQLEPEAGGWQLEYAFGRGEATEHSVQLMHGMDDHLAIGAEIALTRNGGVIDFDSAGIAVLWRAGGVGEGRMGWGVKVQASLDRDGHIGESEVRLITDARPGGWWLQGDVILRRVREHGTAATGLAYAVSVQRAAAGIWLGAEASGRAARIGGAAELLPLSHYAGPSADWEIGERLEISGAVLARVSGRGAKLAPRLAVQLNF